MALRPTEARHKRRGFFRLGPRMALVRNDKVKVLAQQSPNESNQRVPYHIGGEVPVSCHAVNARTVRTAIR